MASGFSNWKRLKPRFGPGVPTKDSEVFTGYPVSLGASQ